MIETDELNIVVPVSRDGSALLPDVRRRRGYQAGPKGGETWTASYWEALRVATRTGHFRRASATSGRFGIVTTDRYCRVPLAEIERWIQRISRS